MAGAEGHSIRAGIRGPRGRPGEASPCRSTTTSATTPPSTPRSASTGGEREHAPWDASRSGRSTVLRLPAHRSRSPSTKSPIRGSSRLPPPHKAKIAATIRTCRSGRMEYAIPSGGHAQPAQGDGTAGSTCSATRESGGGWHRWRHRRGRSASSRDPRRHPEANAPNQRPPSPGPLCDLVESPGA